MSAGLPGLGLGGLFFILSAVLAPLVELVRLLAGRSSLARWRRIGRHLLLVAAMVASVLLTLQVAYALIALAGGSGGWSITSLSLPLRSLAITASLLITVLAIAKLAHLASLLRPRALGGWCLRTLVAPSAALRRRLAEWTES